eukprot:3537460-Pyramimonas_sp.AAC.1
MTMCLAKLRPTTKPCCALWVRSATADSRRKLAAPAMALISLFLSESGRVSSGALSVCSSPTRLSPFGRKAKSESFRS